MVEALRWHECFSAAFSSNLKIVLGALNYGGKVRNLGSVLLFILRLRPVLLGSKNYVVRFYVSVCYVLCVVHVVKSFNDAFKNKANNFFPVVSNFAGDKLFDLLVDEVSLYGFIKMSYLS